MVKRKSVSLLYCHTTYNRYNGQPTQGRERGTGRETGDGGRKLNQQFYFFVTSMLRLAAMLISTYVLLLSSTRFGWYHHPSSGAHVNCKYSIWHWSNRICYRPLLWWSRNSDSSTTAEGSKYGSTSARCCNYSLHVFLMMDDGIIRNM